MGKSGAKKKIVILVDQLYLNGGIERLVVLKANYWSERFGYDVVVLSTEQEGKPFAFDLSDKVRFIDLGINFHRQISYFHPRNLTKFAKNIRIVRKWLRVEQPTHILVASHIPITYFINFIKGNAITIKEYHYTKYFHTLSSIKAKVEQQLESKFNFNVVLSQEEATYHHLDNLIVIPNPVDWEIVAPNSLNPVVTKRMFFLGRMAPVKNLEAMLQVWAKFQAKGFSDWHLDIMGSLDTDYAQEMQQLARQLHLEETVHFVGNVKLPQKQMHRYDAMLLTSHQECFPMVILEAFANGVPVISFDSPTGPRNMISHAENGLLVPLNNIDEFANALSIFASDIHLKNQLGQVALQTASNYKVDTIMQIWKDKIFES